MPVDSELPDQALSRLLEVPPAAFTTTRDALVREFRDRGREKTARALKKLRRPTLSVWL